MSRRAWECRVCRRRFDLEQSLHQHMRAVHHDHHPHHRSDNDSYYDGSEDSYNDYHKDGLWECMRCGRTFATEQSLDQHQRTLNHRGKRCNQQEKERGEGEWSRPWECLRCGRTFVTEFSLIQHQDTVNHRDRTTNLHQNVNNVLLTESFAKKRKLHEANEYLLATVENSYEYKIKSFESLKNKIINLTFFNRDLLKWDRLRNASEITMKFNAGRNAFYEICAPSLEGLWLSRKNLALLSKKLIDWRLQARFDILTGTSHGHWVVPMVVSYLLWLEDRYDSPAPNLLELFWI